MGSGSISGLRGSFVAPGGSSELPSFKGILNSTVSALSGGQPRETVAHAAAHAQAAALFAKYG